MQRTVPRSSRIVGRGYRPRHTRRGTREAVLRVPTRGCEAPLLQRRTRTCNRPHTGRSNGKHVAGRYRQRGHALLIRAGATASLVRRIRRRLPADGMQATYRFARTESRLRLRGKVRSKYEIVVIDGLNLCRVARAADYENADVDLRGVAPADP